MAGPMTVAAQRRHVLDGQKERRLWVATPRGRRYPDDEPWVTESHWIMPCRRLARLWQAMSATAPLDGAWMLAEKTLTHESPEVPEMLPTYLEAACYEVPLTGVGGARQHFVRDPGTPNYLALFTRPDGTEVAVRADWLALLTADGDLSRVELGYGYRYAGAPVLRQATQRKDALSAIGVFAERIAIHDAHIGDDGKWVPKREEHEGLRLLGVLMPVRLT